MQVLTTIQETRELMKTVREKGQTIGFVPTMGALHKGHLSLFRHARKDNQFVVGSIFVNPLQFNDTQDLYNYPRDLKNDLVKLEAAACDLVFTPTEEEMYPGPVSEAIDLGGLDTVLEGKYREGHFTGVAIVVKRLFEIIEPTRAYFGLKDYQQVLIINHFVKKNHLPVEIIPCPTVREEDGLAMSSRNLLLSKNERRVAPQVHKILKTVKLQAGYLSVGEIKAQVDAEFGRNKMMKLEYFDIVDMYTLKPIKNWTDSSSIIACIAVYLGKVRLIDNVILFS
jgi:pantoate--beta-alanine ligase